MKRREFIILVGGAAAWPFTARAQQPIGHTGKMPRLGMLTPGSSANSGTVEPFYRGLSGLGYVEGKNIVIERRYADGDVKRLSDQAAELVMLRPDIIVAWSTPSSSCSQAQYKHNTYRCSSDGRSGR